MADEILGTFELPAEIERYAPGGGASGRRAETLIKSDQLRVVLVTMRAGAELAEHSAPGAITIHCLHGAVTVEVGSVRRALAVGGLIAIAPGVRHAVRADADGAFLLTIANAGGRQPAVLDA